MFLVDYFSYTYFRSLTQFKLNTDEKNCFNANYHFRIGAYQLWG